MYRVRLFPLFKNMPISTLVGGQVQTKMDLDVPGFRAALIQAEAIFVMSVTDVSAGNLVDWNVQFISGLDRQHERAPVDISGLITNPGRKSGPGMGTASQSRFRRRSVGTRSRAPALLVP